MTAPTDGDGSNTSTTTPSETTSNPYQVAIVFTTGGLGDKGFNDEVYNGAARAHSDYSIDFTYSEPAAISDYEQVYREYATHAGYTDPYDLIIGVGSDQADTMIAVARDFPNQQFAIIDMFIDPSMHPNVSSVLFTENEGSALVGVIAGMMTKTNKIGFLGGMDIDLIRKYAAGFVFGASLVNPVIEHIEQYTGDWVDTTLGRNLAHSIYASNADIVFAAAGRAGLGAFEAAKEDNVTSPVPLWVIGYDVPQMYLGCEDPDNPAPPTVCLTSMLKHADIVAYDLIYDRVVGTWHSGLKVYDLVNGGQSYEIDTALLTLPQNVIDTVEIVRTCIINGTYVVPAEVYWA